jgi:hypothetical protein
MARYALIVGINKYAQGRKLKSLRYAEKDAEDIARVFGDKKRGQCGVSLLLGGEASASAVNKALDDLICQKAKYDDTVIMYFAGHGKKDMVGDFCLCLFDTNTGSLARTALHVNNLETYINNSYCRRFAMFFDACFSGAAGRRLVGARGNRSSVISLTEFAKEGRVIVSSCTPYQAATEDKGLGHGEFTYHLLAALRKHAGDQFGNISVSALYSDVYRRMEQAGSGQLPVIWEGEIGDIVIARSAVARRNVTSPARRRYPFTVPSSYVHCRLPGGEGQSQLKHGSPPAIRPSIRVLVDNPRTGRSKPLYAQIDTLATVSVFPESVASEMDLSDMGAIQLATGFQGSKMEISMRRANLYALGRRRKPILLNGDMRSVGFVTNEALPNDSGVLPKN